MSAKGCEYTSRKTNKKWNPKVLTLALPVVFEFRRFIKENQELLGQILILYITWSTCNKLNKFQLKDATFFTLVK